MSVKTAGVGHFAIPTAPAAGTSCTSGAANVFTTTYVQLIASTSAALYITGIYVEAAAALGGTYDVVQLATGGAGSETIVGQYLINLSTGTTTATGYRPIYPPIPVANATRIACKTADSVGAKATLITLECIAQSNVVDDGITVGTVNLVNTLTTYTGNTLQTGDSFAIVKSGGTGDNAAIKAKTDNLPAAPASTTNITAGTITTTTNMTNAPTAGDFTAAMKTSLNAATPASVTGAVGSVTGSVGSVTGAVGSVTARVTANSDQLAGQTVTAAAGVTFPNSVASPTNITAGTITTATNLTNAPTVGDFTAAMKTSIGTAVAASAVASVTGNVGGNVTGSVGSVTGLTASDVGAIKAKTDSLTFTVASKLDANVLVINGVTVIGSGTALDLWRA
jgi:hypothetical protein